PGWSVGRPGRLQYVARTIGRLETERVRPRRVQPALGPGRQAATPRPAKLTHQVVESGVIPGVILEVAAKAAYKGVLAYVRDELLENAGTLHVGDPVKPGGRLGDITRRLADRV